MNRFLIFFLAVAFCVVALLAWAMFSPPSARVVGGGPAVHVERVIRAHSAEVWGVAFSPDSQTLATSSVDGTVKLWRVADGTLLRTLPQPAGITAVAFSPDGQWLSTSSYDLLIRVWRVADGTL